MILDKLRRLTAEYFSADEEDIAPETEYMSDLGADSFELAQFLSAVQDELDLPELNWDELAEAFDGERPFDCLSVGDLAEYLGDKM